LLQQGNEKKTLILTYNIELLEDDNTEFTMAVAGLAEEECCMALWKHHSLLAAAKNNHPTKAQVFA